jgi:hypothetical protein
VASKSAYSDSEKGAEIEEQLEDLDKRVDRLRAMYEQYFMGIVKQAPSHLHSEAERKIRDMTQLQIRNTGLRYRFATITQKFGAYNTYWRRTLREIESGRYIRDLSRVKRKAQAAGEDIPPEILAAMPRRMREMVERDRAAVKAAAARRAGPSSTVAPPIAPAEDGEPHDHDEAAVVHAPIPRKQTWTLDMNDDVDVDQMFDDITGESEKQLDPKIGAATVAPPVPRAPTLPAPGAPPVRSTLPPPPMKRPAARSEPSDTIPTPMEFPPFDEEAPTSLRKPGETLAPPLPNKPPAPVRPSTVVGAAPPPVPRVTQALPRPPVPRPPAPTPPPRPAARVSPLEPPPGMSEDDTRALYTKFLKARTLVGEKNDDMTYDKLLRTLRSQGSKIMEQYKAKGVEFGVVIKDNKVVLKAKPKA